MAVTNKSADLLGRAIEAKLKPLNSRVKILTVDNGKEFADHQAIDQILGIQTYFVDPYCSWQHGSNDNFNGLLRQYVPKTPHEVFHASLSRVAPRTCPPSPFDKSSPVSCWMS